MKKIVAIGMMLALIALLVSGCSNKIQIISITTGGTGGTYYPIGGAIAKNLSENIDGLIVNAQGGNASVANCNLIKEGAVESALVQNNVAYWAYEGIGIFEGNEIDSLRGIASLYPEAIQIVALKSSDIHSVEDLVGKRVGVGEIGSGIYFDVVNVLEAHGIAESDIEADYLDFSQASQKIKDNEIDAAFVTAGYPTSTIIDINLVSEMVIVPIAVNKIDRMIEASPFYAKTVIPAGTYSGLDADVITATTMAMWVIDESVDETLVYKMTKTFWENKIDMEPAHEKVKEATLKSALDGMGIPLHPGAKKYYEEAGIK